MSQTPSNEVTERSELKARAREIIQQLDALYNSKRPGGGVHGQVIGMEPWTIRTTGDGLQCMYEAQYLLHELLDPFDRLPATPTVPAIPRTSAEAVLYQTRMRAPNGNTGPWCDVEADVYARFRDSSDIGDGFSYETRALFDHVLRTVTMDEAELLAGVQCLCIAANQELTRQGGELSEWDKGWFTGQLQVFDLYTPIEKAAIISAREYFEKLFATPAPAEHAKPEPVGISASQYATQADYRAAVEQAEGAAELCQWLRDHSSGAYRQCAEAADLIERLTGQQAGAVDGVRAALNEYYDALTDRKNGSAAEITAFSKIQSAMGMSWEARKAARAASANQKGE